MPTFNDYSANGKLLGTRNEPLNSENFQRFILEQGTERAQGYFDAINDFMKELEQVLFHESIAIGGGLVINSKTTVRTRLKEFYSKKSDFQNVLTQIVSPTNSELASNTDANLCL